MEIKSLNIKNGYKVTSTIFLILGFLLLIPFIKTFIFSNDSQDPDLFFAIKGIGSLLVITQAVIFFGLSLLFYEIHTSKSKPK